MTAPFKPLLAAKADLDALRFPLLASPKLDGIRAMTGIVGAICSRNLKEIPNRHIRRIAEQFPTHLDGEILTYTNGTRDDFNTVQSKVMSADGEPDFRFHVFDSIADLTWGFDDRLQVARGKCDGFDRLHVVSHTYVHSLEDITDLENDFVDLQGWEGVMLRDPHGSYKFGRSTAKEQILLKVKRFDDDEAVVVGTVERMHNANEARTNALGHTERSSHKANLVPTGTLGALVCEWKGVRFEIGTGFNDAQRQSFWDDRDLLIGSTVTFKFQGTGSQGAPRFPVFLGFRKDLLLV